MREFIPDTIQGSVPFFLKAEELPLRPDSLPVNFGRYEFLPTDTHRIYFDVDSLAATGIHPFHAGIAGTAMPFSPWVESVIFLLFLICFVIFSLVFRREGVAFMGNFRNIITLGKRTASGYKEQVTTTEVWGEFFMIAQTILVITILLFTYSWDRGLSSFSLTEYFLFFAGVFSVLAALVGMKFLMYKTIGTFFLKNDIKNWTSRFFRLIEFVGVISFFPAVLYVYLHELRDIILIILLIVFL